MNDLKVEIATFRSNKELILKVRQQTLSGNSDNSLAIQVDDVDLNAIHLIAFVDSNPIATLRIVELDEITAKIEKYLIVPDFQERGLEKFIIDHALHLININDFEIVLVKDRQSRKIMYEKLGFELVGETFRESGIDYIQMVKKVIVFNQIYQDF